MDRLNDIKKEIIKFNVGSYYKFIFLFLFSPFLYEIYESFNPGVDQFNIVPSMTTLIGSTIVCTILVLIRILRDIIVKRRLEINENSTVKKTNSTIKYLKRLKSKSKDTPYDLKIVGYIDELILEFSKSRIE